MESKLNKIQLKWKNIEQSYINQINSLTYNVNYLITKNEERYNILNNNQMKLNELYNILNTYTLTLDNSINKSFVSNLSPINDNYATEIEYNTNELSDLDNVNIDDEYVNDCGGYFVESIFNKKPFGIEIKRIHGNENDNELIVNKVVYDGIAMRKGVKVGWKIVGVNGVECMDDVVNELKKENGPFRIVFKVNPCEID